MADQNNNAPINPTTGGNASFNPGSLSFGNIVNAILSLIGAIKGIQLAVTGITIACPPYDIAVNFQGVPTASQKFRWTAPRPVIFAANFTSIAGGTSYSTADVAATASSVFTIWQAPAATPNTFTQIGTVTYGASAAVGVFASTGGASFTLAAGDVLRIVAPSSADATLAGISITMAGER